MTNTQTPAAALPCDADATRLAAGPAPDLAYLRRRRENTEKTAELALHLPPADRALFQQVHVHGVSVRQIAFALDTRHGPVYRRLARIRKTLADPAFALLIRFADQLEPDIRRPAERILLHGRSLRQAAGDTGLPLHRVRLAMKTVRALSELRKPRRRAAGHRHRFKPNRPRTQTTAPAPGATAGESSSRPCLAKSPCITRPTTADSARRLAALAAAPPSA